MSGAEAPPFGLRVNSGVSSSGDGGDHSASRITQRQLTLGTVEAILALGEPVAHAAEDWSAARQERPPAKRCPTFSSGYSGNRASARLAARAVIAEPQLKRRDWGRNRTVGFGLGEGACTARKGRGAFCTQMPHAYSFRLLSQERIERIRQELSSYARDYFVQNVLNCLLNGILFPGH